MAVFLRIESEQEGQCFDCDRWLKIYGVQKVVHLSGGNLFQFENETVLRLPPLLDGWSWRPTCRECGMKHEKEESS